MSKFFLLADTRVFSIAARVASNFPDPVRNPDEETMQSGLPGEDSYVFNTAPFQGMGLSTNPHPKISPQILPATIYRDYEAGRKLPVYVGDSEVSLSSSRREVFHSGLRGLVK